MNGDRLIDIVKIASTGAGVIGGLVGAWSQRRTRRLLNQVLIRIDELLRELEAAHPADKPETLRYRHRLDAKSAELLVTKFDGWFKATAQLLRSPFRR